MSYQRCNKGGRVAKSPFLAKSVQKSLNKKNKIDFFQKTTFFELPIGHKRFFEHSSFIWKTSKELYLNCYLSHIIVSDVSDF